MLLVFELSAVGLHAQTEIPGYQAEVLKKFQAGINISLYENYWKSRDEILRENIFAKLDLAHHIGFTTISLPVDFDLFLDKNGNELNQRLLDKLSAIDIYLEQWHMNLIITCFYGQIYNKTNIKAEGKRVVYIWKQLVNYFKGRCYDHLYFGLYNEPRVPGSKWNIIDAKMMQHLRPFDESRVWVVGSPNYNGADAFIHFNLVPNDNKIIYTFHFYQPYIFTHQGAPWDLAKTYLTVLPYPYDADAMPELPKKAIGTDVEYNYQHYDSKANRDFIIKKIEKVREWSMEHHVPVICTETGVIATVPDRYRNNYIAEVTDVMQQMGIPAMIWDLDQTFKIINKNNQPLKSVRDWIDGLKESKN